LTINAIFETQGARHVRGNTGGRDTEKKISVLSGLAKRNRLNGHHVSITEKGKERVEGHLPTKVGE
jgi:hypothetical protein